VKLRGIKLTGYSLKDGKPVKRPRKQSVSERIRISKSKRVRPKKGPMSTRIGKATVTTKDGKTKLEPPKRRLSVSDRIGQKKKADREEKAWRSSKLRGNEK